MTSKKTWRRRAQRRQGQIKDLREANVRVNLRVIELEQEVSALKNPILKEDVGLTAEQNVTAAFTDESGFTVTGKVSEEFVRLATGGIVEGGRMPLAGESTCVSPWQEHLDTARKHENRGGEA